MFAITGHLQFRLSLCVPCLQVLFLTMQFLNQHHQLHQAIKIPILLILCLNWVCLGMNPWAISLLCHEFFLNFSLMLRFLLYSTTSAYFLLPLPCLSLVVLPPSIFVACLSLAVIYALRSLSFCLSSLSPCKFCLWVTLIFFLHHFLFSRFRHFFIGPILLLLHWVS